MNEKIDKIKTDMKRLRTLRHAIESAKKAKERHEQMIELIKGGAKETSQRILERLYTATNSLGIEELIEELSTLENTYLPKIRTLEPFDRTLFIDNAINGMSYTMIANKIGYSKRGIEERIKRIYNKIAL